MGFVVEFVNPVLFELGSLKLYTYGLFLALAFMVTEKMLARELAKHNITTDTTNILIAAAVGGIVGAKLHYVLTWDPEALFNLNTGLSFQGGLLGGALAVSAYIWFSGESVAAVAEHAAPLMPLGHAIGKLGCFFSGDGCYGSVTSLPWGMSFPNGLNPTRKFVHPAPLYEFILSFSIFAYYFANRDAPQFARRLPWDKFTRVLAAMCFSRVIVELWRGHDVILSLGPLGGINQFQIFAVVAGVCVLMARFVISKTLWNAPKAGATKPTPRKASKKTN